VKKDLIEVLLM